MIMDEGLIGYKNSICAYEALEDTVLILFEISMLRKMLDENESLKDFYIASLEWGMRYKIYRENEFLTNNATQRYLKFREDFPEIADRVKQSYISTYLGIAPESLSRIRKALKEENGED
jgi:CRP-like cAMP-binding protein